MNRRKIGFLVGILMCGATMLAQVNRVDSLRTKLGQDLTQSEKVETLHQLFGAMVNSVPDTALIYAKRAHRLSLALEVDTLHGQSIMNLVHAYFVNQHVDSAKMLLLSAIPFYENTQQFFFLSATYRNLAVIGEANLSPDSSLFYLEKCLGVLEQHPDSIVMGDVYLSKGFAYRTKGHYQLSIEALLNALRIFEVIGHDNRKGYAAQNIGLTLTMVGRLADALERNQESLIYFRAANNDRAAAQSLNNIGRLSFLTENKGLAVRSHLESIELCKSSEQPDVEMDNYFNLGRLYFEENQFDSATFWLTAANELAQKINSSFIQGAVNRYRARIHLVQGDKTRARQYLDKAVQYLEAYVDPQDQVEAYSEMSLISEQLEQAELALQYQKKAKSIEDSLFTLRQDQQVEELRLIYQTEKKDAAIALLNKTTELDQIRKRALRIGLLLIVLVACSIIYALLQRRRKERFRLEKEKEIEIERRRHAEQALEFKKKELLAKTLQLARKNEFLGTLETEVDKLKSTIDKEVRSTSQRIVRLIDQDAADKEEWEHFSKEFASIHQEFLDALVAKHGAFSSSDVRLISLLKMNLSSKDIALTLRISAEGVKKARYRLRKKLALDKADDLQAYLLSFASGEN